MAQPMYSGAPRRSTAVTIFAILNIVFGALGLICGPLSLVQIFVPQPGPAGQIYGLMRQGPYLIWLIAGGLFGLVMSGVLIASGIGMLRLASWGRLLGIMYGAYGLFAAVATTAMYAGFVLPPAMQMAEAAEGPERAGQIGGAIGGMIRGFCGGIFYPMILLVFLLLPGTAAAFRQAAEVAPAASPPPPEYPPPSAAPPAG
jgi:hypothetical protein